jgi:hypothetical protein
VPPIRLLSRLTGLPWAKSSAAACSPSPPRTGLRSSPLTADCHKSRVCSRVELAGGELPGVRVAHDVPRPPAGNDRASPEVSPRSISPPPSSADRIGRCRRSGYGPNRAGAAQFIRRSRRCRGSAAATTRDSSLALHGAGCAQDPGSRSARSPSPTHGLAVMELCRSRHSHTDESLASLNSLRCRHHCTGPCASPVVSAMQRINRQIPRTARRARFG